MKRIITVFLLCLLVLLSGCSSDSSSSSVMESASSKNSSDLSVGGEEASSSSEEERVKRITENYKSNLSYEQSENWQTAVWSGDEEFGPIPGIIYDQGADYLKNIKYGSNTVLETGCGAIALYNALVLMGEKPTLSKVIYELEMGDMLLFNGAFGTNPAACELIAEKYGFNYKYADELAQLDGWQSSNGVVIFTYWNEAGNITKGSHIIAVSILGDEIRAYNMSVDATGTAVFEDFNSLLAAVNGEFICAYYLVNEQE